MRKRILVAWGALALASLLSAQQGKADRTLKVKLNYTGSGKVDGAHKIFIFLFDSPDFAQGGVMPIANQAARAKDETATFSNLSSATVYVVAAFDPSGGYDGMSGPPPPGSSMGIYSKGEGKPAPVTIEAGKTAQIEVTFDDSAKMP
jgi:hypothetical protein